MPKLSTHVLDTHGGLPAAGMAIEFCRVDDAGETLIARLATNHDGRTDAPLLAGDALPTGRYRLRFAVGDYFRARGVALPEPAFLDAVAIDFGIAEPQGSYHVPLLCSPWSYSTYRGS